MTNSEDSKWINEGLKFWKEQVVKNPHNKKAQRNLEWFEKWAKELKINN